MIYIFFNFSGNLTAIRWDLNPLISNGFGSGLQYMGNQKQKRLAATVNLTTVFLSSGGLSREKQTSALGPGPESSEAHRKLTALDEAQSVEKSIRCFNWLVLII